MRHYFTSILDLMLFYAKSMHYAFFTSDRIFIQSTRITSVFESKQSTTCSILHFQVTESWMNLFRIRVLGDLALVCRISAVYSNRFIRGDASATGSYTVKRLVNLHVAHFSVVYLIKCFLEHYFFERKRNQLRFVVEFISYFRKSTSNESGRF